MGIHIEIIDTWLLLGCSLGGFMLEYSRAEFIIKCNQDELKIQCCQVGLILNRNRVEFMLGCIRIKQQICPSTTQHQIIKTTLHR